MAIGKKMLFNKYALPNEFISNKIVKQNNQKGNIPASLVTLKRIVS